MIYIIITTCLINKFGIKDDIHRQNRYTDSIRQILKLVENDLSIKPIIVENNGLRQTFLDDFECDVIYTNNNNIPFNYIRTVEYKALIELLDIKEVINRYKIHDDDIIIKLTGRYKLLNLNFINLVKTGSDDAFVKFFNVCTKKYEFNDCVLGLFAIKCKYLKGFDYRLIKSPEVEFAEYIRKNINKISEINHLYLECCFADDLRILYV